MPVGRVFDARQGQVLFSPVSNYYKGEAIRSGLATEKQNREQAVDKLALEKERVGLEGRRVAATERNTETAEGALAQRITEYEDRVGEETSKRNAWDLYFGVSDINSKVQSGELSEEDALISARDYLIKYADSLPEGAKEQADGIRAAINDRDGLTLEEWQEIGSQAESGAGYYGFITSGSDDPVTLADGGMLVDKNGRVIVENPKDFNPSSGSDKQDFEPINAGEREAAEVLVKEDDVLNDLPSKHRKIATEILANDIRQLQASQNLDYATAALVAKEVLKTKIKEVPGFWSSHPEIDLDSPALQDNEYIVNGTIYVRDANGNITARD